MRVCSNCLHGAGKPTTPRFETAMQRARVRICTVFRPLFRTWAADTKPRIRLTSGHAAWNVPCSRSITMSDLSINPALSLTDDDPATEIAARLDSDVWCWPTPALASFPPPQEQNRPLACEIEGLNGKIMRGRLIS